ncbi:MAG: GTPase Era [Candidatus Omnitrophota bacterium]|nr:MAG: GTPase Era [Candidatus Omnitrophota bacterium]
MDEILERRNFKSGFVAILGRPNVGKSTLLNTLLGGKVSIVSSIPQTTRHQIRGVLNLENAQIIFVDTPGIHSFKKELATHLNVVAKRSTQEVELLLYVVDVSRSVGKEEEVIMNFLSSQDTQMIMVLNKIDISKDFLNQYIERWQKLIKAKGKEDLVKYYIPISAKKGTNLDRLKEAIVELLPFHPPFYDRETLTDFPLKLRVQDTIREKLFLNLKEELPHSVAVEVEEVERKENIVYIKANIYVNRDSQKKILIGKEGRFIKEVGKLAREELEVLFGKKVYLELEVKVLRNWQKKPRILKELGYWWV